MYKRYTFCRIVLTEKLIPRTLFGGFFYEVKMENVVYEDLTENTHQKELSIGAVAKILGCNKSLLRYYEEQFEIEVPRSKSNRRYYTVTELEKFRYILKLKDSGLSNPEIKSVLDSERVNRTEYEFLATDRQEESFTPPKSDELKALYDIIAGLRDEINELKNMGAVLEKSELIEENKALKQKLKEKTYELVSLRENTKPKKKGFFR